MQGGRHGSGECDLAREDDVRTMGQDASTPMASERVGRYGGRSVGRAGGLAVLGALGLGLTLAACDEEGTTGPQSPAYMQVALTGAGGGGSAASQDVVSLNEEEVASAIESAEVWISEVYFQGVPDEGQGRVEVFKAENEGDRQVVDLMDLHEGVDVFLGDEPEEVVPGRYGQLRLVVDEATVVVDGEEMDLKIPSGEQTGIKVLPPRENDEDEENGDDENGENGENGDEDNGNGDENGNDENDNDNGNEDNGENDEEAGDVEVDNGEIVTVVVSVDVEENFVLQGPPGEVTGVLFTPTLRQGRVAVENTGG